MIRFQKIEQELAPLLPLLKPYFKSRSGVVSAYLVGTCASGQQHPLTDVAIGVWLHPDLPTFSYFDQRLEMMGEIAAILGTGEIDLLILNELPTIMAYHIIQPRYILYERYPEMRVRFETSVIDRYLDSAPLRKVQRSYLKRQIREGSFFGES